MKNLFSIAMLLCVAFYAFSQKEVKYPNFSGSTAEGFIIEKVMLTDSATILDCSYTGGRFSIPRGTYISSDQGETKRHIISCKEFKLGKRQDPNGEVLHFQLTFPTLPTDAKTFDYIEGNKGGTWSIYDVELVERARLSYITREYAGNWYTADDRNAWVISIDDVVVYNGEIYSAISSTVNENIYTLELGERGLTLYLEMRDSLLYLGEDKDDLKACTKKASRLKQYNGQGKVPPAIFDLDTATLCAYLSNYSPRIGKTGTLSFSNVISGEHENHLIELNEDGTFELKVPLYFPTQCYIRCVGYSFSVLLTPGNRTFVKPNMNRSVDVYGEYSVLNEQLVLMRYLSSYKYNTVKEKIGEWSIEEYMAYCSKAYHKDTVKWRECVEKFEMSNEIFAYGMDIVELSYAVNMLNYEMRQRSHQRAKAKEGIVYEYDTLTASYFDFLDDLPLNDAKLITLYPYGQFINRMMYLDIFRLGPLVFTLENEKSYLLKKGVEFDKEDEELFTSIDKTSTLLADQEYSKYYGYRSEVIHSFTSKLTDQIRQFRKTISQTKEGFAYYTELSSYLKKDSTVQLSTIEYQVLDSLGLLETAEYIALRAKHLDESSKLRTKYSTYFMNMYRDTRRDFRNEKLDMIFGDKAQLTKDIMNSQDLCPSLDKPIALDDLAKVEVENTVASDLVKKYIYIANDRMLTREEDNKHKTGFTKHEVPKSTAEKLFNEIIKPYRGKVIYVDFWATWCGPCRSGMKKITPLKEEFKGRDDIVFLYITNETSPESIYNNMIPDIKGEHYRVSKDAWNYFSTEFGITGIPHYMLVNKKGEVVINDRTISPYHLEGLKKTIIKYTKEN